MNDNRVVSYKPEVQADNTGTWAGNACRFATEEEAEAYVCDLATRWTLVRHTRIVPSDDPVTCQWVEARTYGVSGRSKP